MRTAAIIQARMGSTRFPGKMLQPICGRPLVEWVLTRTARSTRVDDVVLATSTLPHDDVLEEWADRVGVICFRGSEQDVLGRYAEAARKVRADTVVRICADRPLIDPDCIDSAIHMFVKGEADLVFNHISDKEEFWPRGFGAEVFSSDKLDWLDQNVSDVFEREHVTLHLWNHRKTFKLQPVPCPVEMDLGVPDTLFDVDYPEDLEKLETLCVGRGMDISASKVIDLWRTTMRNAPALE